MMVVRLGALRKSSSVIVYFTADNLEDWANDVNHFVARFFRHEAEIREEHTRFLDFARNDKLELSRSRLMRSG